MTNTTYNFLMDIISFKNLTLSKSENIIMEKFKNNNIDLETVNIKDLANELEVSNSTITRFAQKLGFDGFAELKYEFSKKSHKKDSLSQEIYKKIIEDLPSFDEKTLSFIKSLPSFGKIAVIGIGSSGLCANEFVFKFGEIGLNNTDYAKEPYSIDLLTKSLGADDLLIAISLSGENHNLLEGVRIAHKRKSRILAITNSPKSTLANLADLTILTPAYPTYSYKISKLFPVTLILDMICESFLT